MIEKQLSSRNTLSDEKHFAECLKPFETPEFKFDLQLFGKGGGGKSKGKLLFSLVGFALGGIFWGALGAASWLGGAIMGASLFSTIWSATHKPKINDPNQGDLTIQRFDKSQEGMSSTCSIPIVYGERKMAGNQTYHQVNADLTQLHKHVVLCEGGIQGVRSVTANGLMIPTGTQTANTVFTIRNNKYEDAWVQLIDKKLTLGANGQTKTIELKNKDDMTGENAEKSFEFWEYQVSISSLVSYINQRYVDGWECFPVASTNKYPGDLCLVHPATNGQEKPHLVGKFDMSVKSYIKGDTITFPSNGSGSFPRELAGKSYHVTRTNTVTETGGGQNARYFLEVYGYLVYGGSSNRAYCYQNSINFTVSTVVGGTAYTFHDCETPDTYNETGGYPKMAWLDMKFFSSAELNGNPNVECVVQGKKVYDPRTGQTAYSTNPALCTLDFLTSFRYGLGRWITQDDLDLDSFKNAANYCDEVIEFEDSNGNHIRAKRYELNMIIDQRQSAINWLQEILGNFSGYLVYSQGKLKLLIERETPISYKFTDDDILNVSISQLELDECPNEYSVSIIDPRNNWKTIKCKVSDYADQKVRGRIVKKDVELEGVTSQYQALRLARFYRDYNLTCSLQLSFTTGLQGMHLEPGDVVTVTYRDVFTELPIRIMEIKETEENQYEISGRQYNASLYSDDLGGGVQWHIYVNGGRGLGTKFKSALPDVIQNVTAYTKEDDEILIEHSPSDDPDFKEYRYYVEEVTENG